MDELVGFKSVYTVPDLFEIIQNRKLKIDGQIERGEHIKYRSALIDLSYFLKTLKKEVEKAKIEYLQAVTDKKSMKEEVFILSFQRGGTEPAIGFMLDYQEVHMTSNIIDMQLEEISSLEKKVLFQSLDTAFNPALSNSSAPASHSTHPSGPYSHQPQ